MKYLYNYFSANKKISIINDPTNDQQSKQHQEMCKSFWKFRKKKIKK